MIVHVGERTDIVNYFSEWFMNRIKEGYVYSRNPLFDNTVSKISLKPEDVDCLMFCSKNYKPMLKYMDEINKKYRVICYYTITAYEKDVEPNVPSIDDSVKTLKELSQIIGKEKVLWRYDPILLTKKYTTERHLKTFEYMAKQLAPYIQRCIFSFVEMYKKVNYNMPEIIRFTDEDKKIILQGIGEISKKYNLYTQTCGTDENFEMFGIHASGCATTEILEQANNVKYKNIKTKGKRKGCHCITSRDIGAYNTCLNGCKYCYANITPNVAKQNIKFHDKKSPLLLGNINKMDKIVVAKQENIIKEYSVNKLEQLSFI